MIEVFLTVSRRSTTAEETALHTDDGTDELIASASPDVGYDRCRRLAFAGRGLVFFCDPQSLPDRRHVSHA
jgi:hypothetical protein